MKKATVLSILILFLLGMSAVASAEMEPVKVGFGSLSLHMNLQAGFIYYVGDETLGKVYDDEDNFIGYQANDRRSDYSFVLNRARLIFKGHILTDKITYLTQTEFNASGVELYDMFMSFHYIPFTSINIGRFVPNYGFFTDRSTADLIFIDYPLYGLKFMMGSGDSARDWRHVGLWFNFLSTYVDAQLGVWNGFTGKDNDGDGLADSLQGAGFGADTNSGKDITASITGKPIEGLKIRASLWWGQPLAGYENEDGELTEYNNTILMFGGGVFYRGDFGLTAGAEYHHRIFSLADFDLQDGPDPDSYTSFSYNLFAGFNLDHFTGVPVELLVRYDYFDPNSANDEDEASVVGISDSANDQIYRITGAVNYYIEGLHSVIRLNYIHQQEDWKDVLNKEGDDTQTGINDDTVKLQVQVAF